MLSLFFLFIHMAQCKGFALHLQHVLPFKRLRASLVTISRAFSTIESYMGYKFLMFPSMIYALEQIGTEFLCLEIIFEIFERANTIL